MYFRVYALINIPTAQLLMWWCSGLVVSALVCGLSGPGSSPGHGHCVVFLARLIGPLFTQVYKWVPRKFNAGGNTAMG